MLWYQIEIFVFPWVCVCFLSLLKSDWLYLFIFFFICTNKSSLKLKRIEITMYLNDWKNHYGCVTQWFCQFKNYTLWPLVLHVNKLKLIVVDRICMRICELHIILLTFHVLFAFSCALNLNLGFVKCEYWFSVFF